MTDIEQLITSNPLLTDIRNSEEIFWNNSMYLPVEEATKQTKYSMADIEDAEARLQRFAAFIRVAFPETEATDGIIESPVSEISDMKNYLNDTLATTLDGKLLLKRDDLLPISGTIKARGAIYEVLKHAENLALQKGMLESTEEDYAVFASEAFNEFFSSYHIAVGTTGNLGISVGTMARKLGFNVTVHMSVEAKQWKKDYLRDKGVEVIEHDTDFSKAVENGRAESDANPNSYFVDDEHSVELFLGYTVGGYRMKKQLEREGITVDADHPLFVYLPCGIGGSPGGITFGLKQAFGEHVHCFFAEPTKMPSMLVGLLTEKYDDVSVFDFQLGGLTIADGLAVPRTSGLVAKLMRTFFSGGYSVQEGVFNGLLSSLYDTESIFLEPAAVAGLVGPYRLMKTDNGKGYIESSGLSDKMDQATHIAWATGGSMVPEKDRAAFLEESKAYSIN
ncbi:D-serine ammonia-lyase [Alkalibacterium pelagium]|uniref:Probable D-serine dehydratase n=1 Tax=Alkalibacterium pelagium TaxID=426702 RepID=A0A1H7J6F9_9LACT|nr:D-serine ammonia-lyase [Alkalibacterium pelagium]GEN50271.1 putative D-serine dehydratase [Alkalibacterium pelagium]SEK68705.1 D-serine ammonia-lyase [Alkalibacterium pelagium]